MQEIFEREQEIRKRMEDAGRHILFNARNELFLHMRFLDVALSSFSCLLYTSPSPRDA